MKFPMQLKLLTKTWTNDKFAFGGARLKGSHPKKKRIFRPELALHVVVRSTQARGKHSLLLHNRTVAGILDAQASRHFVRIYAAANAGNHLHLLIQSPSREHLAAFLKAITGHIAQLVGGAQGFWDARPFSRVVSWGRDFKNVARYIGLNSTELLGLSGENVRLMFDQIQQALRKGILAKSPGLVAAGFI